MAKEAISDLSMEQQELIEGFLNEMGELDKEITESTIELGGVKKEATKLKNTIDNKVLQLRCRLQQIHEIKNGTWQHDMFDKEENENK